MDAGYVKVKDDTAAAPREVWAEPGLACWAALVQVWDGIEGTCDDDEVPEAEAPLTHMQPFG